MATPSFISSSLLSGRQRPPDFWRIVTGQPLSCLFLACGQCGSGSLETEQTKSGESLRQVANRSEAGMLKTCSRLVRDLPGQIFVSPLLPIPSLLPLEPVALVGIR